MLKWQWEAAAGIQYITIPAWEKHGVNMLFTSRHQGVSTKPFDSLNLALHVGDENRKVVQNREKVMNIWGRSVDDLICCEQIHGNQVALVDMADRGRGATEYHKALIGYDGMITNSSGLYLALFFADCLPVFLFDPATKVIALVHSGWKGTIGGIVGQAIDKMQQQYPVDKENLQAFIGPGIAKCCFEISPELAERVNSELHDFDDILLQRNGSIFWDLAASNYKLLIKAGLKEENIAIGEICTKCRKDKFFSYRGEGGNTGRMAAIIGLQ